MYSTPIKSLYLVGCEQKLISSFTLKISFKIFPQLPVASILKDCFQKPEMYMKKIDLIYFPKMWKNCYFCITICLY